MATSAFFEVRLNDDDETKGDEEKIEAPQGGMTFSVGLEQGDQSDKNLQLAARLHRIKSEMRRSKGEKTKVSPPPPPTPQPDEKEVEVEAPLELDDLVDSDENVPSETGTYTLRLDSAEVRDRKNLINITHESLNDQNSATESADQGEQSQKSPTIADEPEFEIPTAVSARITEWFNRNDAAESRASDVSTATDSNLDDIREKAKNRIKERNTEKQFSSDTMDESTSNITTSSIQAPKAESSKIVLSREDRASKKTEKKKEPQVRLTRAMLLRKNRALGIKGDESPKADKTNTEKPAPKSAKRISSRLDNLSKPKRVSEVGLANNSRQRSFSHEDAKVYRGRTVAKPVESSKGPTQRKDPSRSTSLTRKSSMTVGSRQDILSRSVRSEKIPSQTPKQKRSTSLTRSSTTQSLKVSSTSKTQQLRKPLTKSATTVSTSRITSSSNSSRPGTASSSSCVRDSHETSILYSLNIISNNCLQKTKAILGEMVDDMSEMNLELEKMTQDDCTDLESLFGRICTLDKCLGRVRQAQTTAPKQRHTQQQDQLPVSIEKPKSDIGTEEETTSDKNKQTIDDHEESEINL